MNKAQLIEAMAVKADLSKTDITKAVDAFKEVVIDSLKEGESVVLVGFGTFAVKHRAARVGRNPKTGEEIRIEAKNVPAFNAGKELKEAVAEAEITAEA